MGLQKDTASNNIAVTAGESMTLEEKYAFLESLGHSDILDSFKDYRERKVRSKPKTAPLDQRVTISVTPFERIQLTNELREIEKNSGKISISQYIRNKATRQIDIQAWREIAESELDYLKAIESSKKDLREKRKRLILEMAENDFEGEDLHTREREVVKIDTELGKLLAKRDTGRSNRLNGRMTMAEAEIVRWRAEQLFLSVSDYLRIMLFDLPPAGIGDSHLGLDARRRFYASIIRVAIDGWGSPPSIYECSQCAHYVEEIRVLQDRVDQLETFV